MKMTEMDKPVGKKKLEKEVLNGKGGKETSMMKKGGAAKKMAKKK